MESLWNDAEAADFRGDLALRVYTSRLLGGDESLVLHGGGNTSVKLDDVLFVKGTGRDLAGVDETSFSRVRLHCARELLRREQLTTAEMKAGLEACLAERSAPRPSIETLMHACLPHRYVEHAHAYSVLAVINTENARRIAEAVYGDLAPLVPYSDSGVELAGACARALRECGTRNTIGLLLQFHGVVAFGETARESYENMIRLVSIAETYLKACGAWDVAADVKAALEEVAASAGFCAAVARVARFAPTVRKIESPLCLAFLRRADHSVLSQQGPSTPQHAVHTKRVPQLGWDVEAYARRYAEYLARTLGDQALARIDAAPRIVIDAESGIYALGPDERSTRIAADFYRRDLEVMLRASAHDRYCAAPEEAIARAELEYSSAHIRAHEATEKPPATRVDAPPGGMR